MLSKAPQFNNKGFTLVEVVVAISILTIGILGIFRVVQDITFSSQINSSKLTAAYLAQERIEQVKNKRDSNWLVGNSWDSNLPSGTESGLLGKFTRNTVILSPGGNKRVVSVVVSWSERGKNYSVKAQSEIYNWYGK